MFVDASALIAMITDEPDGESIADRLQQAVSPITSPLAIYEAVLGVSRKKQGGIKAARRNVDVVLEAAGIQVVPIVQDHVDRALDAFDRYGKGTGHPARLNMGDCFAYALAKAHDTSLLYKGEDFALTDLAGA